MKDETSVFALALGLHGTPWQVQEIKLDAPNKKLTLRLGFARGSRFPHPKTGELLPAHDTLERTWRHNRELLAARVCLEYDSAFRWKEGNPTLDLLEALYADFGGQLLLGMDAAVQPKDLRRSPPSCGGCAAWRRRRRDICSPIRSPT